MPYKNPDDRRAHDRAHRRNRWKNYSKETKRKLNLKKALRRKYGLEIRQLERTYIDQNGLCAICQSPGSFRGPGCLVVDHDHVTSVVRGLLCSRCNWLLGFVRDNKNLLKSGYEYLNKMSATEEGDAECSTLTN